MHLGGVGHHGAHVPRDVHPTLLRGGYNYPAQLGWTPYWWFDWTRYNYPEMVRNLLSQADDLTKRAELYNSPEQRDERRMFLKRAHDLRQQAYDLLGLK